MPLTSTITPYDSNWEQRFKDASEQLGPVFSSTLLEIHHIGSTAIPGLAAKPEIDILVVVDDQLACREWTISLCNFGYVRGGDLSPGHLFYRRNIGEVRTHKIHVCLEGHDQIYRMLTFRNVLRSDSKLRKRYQLLKFRLEKENTNGIGEYLDGKTPFIQTVLDTEGRHIT